MRSALAFLLLATFLCAVSAVRFVPHKYNHPQRSIASSWARVVPQESDLVTLTFALKLHNLDKLEHILMAVSDPRSPSYGKHLSLEQVNSITAPLPQDVAALHQWLISAGAVEVAATQGGDFVTAKMSVKHAQAALLGNTGRIHRLHHKNGHTLYMADSYLSVPDHLSHIIDFVSGLDGPSSAEHNYNPDLVSAVKADLKTTPALIRNRYNITRIGKEPKNLQAVVSFLEQYYSPKDLAQFFAQNSLPNQLVAKDIGENVPGTPGLEASLDVQYLMGVAQGVETYVYYTAGRENGDQEPFMKWLMEVSNSSVVPFVFSISYQDYEDTLTSDYTARVSAEFMKLGTRGVTLVTGSGDWGVGCMNNCKTFQADFPSSSPYIVSTGATQIYALEDNTLAEKAVTFSSGGFSNYFSRPLYQNTSVSGFLAKTTTPTSYFNRTGRGFPDISTVGVNFQVVINGQTTNVGGTSASTPTFAAMVSLINDMRLEAGRPTMGFINPFLYSAASTPNAYYDVTQGSNPYNCCVGFQCEVGWDPITGLGTPNFAVLSSLAMK